MNRFLTILVSLLLILAIARVVVIALGVSWLLLLLYAAIRYPRETLVWLVTLGLLGLASAEPIACIVAIGVIGVAVVIAGALGKSRARMPLGNGRERLSG